MTKKEMFAEIVTLATASERTDIVEFAKAEIERLSRAKSSESESAKAKAKEQNDIKDAILEALTTAGKAITMTELCKFPTLSALSMNKVSAMVTKLKKDGAVVRSEVKRVAYFSIPTETADAETADEE